MKSNPFKKKKYKDLYLKKSRTKRGDNFRNPIKAFKERPSKGKEIYIDSYSNKNKAVWILPLISVLVIILMVFWIGPAMVGFISNRFITPKQTPSEFSLLYEKDDYRVVKVQVADIFFEPDIRADRLTQVLYNEVLKVLDDSNFGFLQVELHDDITGYIMSDNVSNITDGVEPSLFTKKIIVTTQSKRIMTHSTSGTLVMEALMGTQLFSDYAGTNVYRVALPNGDNGWISASGLISIDPFEKTMPSNARSFFETCLSFNNSTIVSGGITRAGASTSGIAYISAKVNGIDLPRKMTEQINYGTNVPIIYDNDTQEINYQEFKNGDLVFFGELIDGGEYNINSMGIVVGYGQVLTENKSTSSIRISRLDNDTNLRNSIISVRRLFEN